MIQNLAPQSATQPQVKKPGQKHFRVNEKDLPKNAFRARFVDSVEELESLLGSWTRLIETAMRPNPFFDPDFLIPAFKYLNQGNVKILIVDAPQRVWPDGPRVLCALFPLAKKRFYGLPLSCYEAWKHDQCFDCTPLIRNDCALEAFRFVFEFLGQEEKTSLLSFDTVSGEGDFARLLTEVIHGNANSVFHRDEFNRACFFPAADAETYINSEVSKNTRKGTLRLERKLADMGELQLEISSPTDDSQRWIEEFMESESSGWKGKNKTSLASNDLERQFFMEMARRTFAAGKMSMLKMTFNGRPLGMVCDLHQGDYGVAYKTAFDESFAEYSPGLIVELNNIHRLHEAKVRMMDSCAAPNHSMINRVWSGRTRYQSLVVALGGNLSRLATATMPLIQLASKTFKKQEQS